MVCKNNILPTNFPYNFAIECDDKCFLPKKNRSNGSFSINIFSKRFTCIIRKRNL